MEPSRIAISARSEDLRAKREPGLNTRQTSCGPLPGNTLRTLFLPRRHGGLPRFLDRLSRVLDGITRSRHRQRLSTLTPTAPKRRQDVGGDPLHDRELLLVRRLHQELTHAGLAVTTNDVGEGIG